MLSAESDFVEKEEQTQDMMVEAIYAHTLAMIEHELYNYTEWLYSQGVLKHRGVGDFDPMMLSQRYIQEKWS